MIKRFMRIRPGQIKSMAPTQHNTRAETLQVVNDLESLLFNESRKTVPKLADQETVPLLAKQALDFAAAGRRAQAKLDRSTSLFDSTFTAPLPLESLPLEPLEPLEELKELEPLEEPLVKGKGVDDHWKSYDAANEFESSVQSEEYQSLKQRNVSVPKATVSDWYVNVSSETSQSDPSVPQVEFVPRWIKAQERAKVREQGETLERSEYISLDEIVSTLKQEQAQNVTVLDVRMSSDTHNYIVIMEGSSERQLYRLMQSLRIKAKGRVQHHGNMPHNVSMEGKNRNAGDWFALDLGGIIIHGFTTASRVKYNLEEVWMFHSNPALSLQLDEFSPDLVVRFIDKHSKSL